MVNKNPDKKDLPEILQNTITHLDDERLVELQNLKQLQEIKNEVFKLERTRLANKYGATHALVKQTDERLAYNQEMFAGLDKEIEKARIKTEPLPANAWRVHGRVYDAKNIPVKDITVFLSDERKTWIEVLGNICTSELGYYSITVDAKQVEAYEKQKQPLYVSVSDKNQKVLYLASTPVFAAKGIIDNHDVYLKDETCVSPPSK